MVQAGGLSSSDYLILYYTQYNTCFGIMVLLAVAPWRTQRRHRLDIRAESSECIPQHRTTYQTRHMYKTAACMWSPLNVISNVKRGVRVAVANALHGGAVPIENERCVHSQPCLT